MGCTRFKIKREKFKPKKLKKLVKEIDLGKKLGFGKKIDLGKKLDFGKPIDLGKEIDLGFLGENEE